MKQKKVQQFLATANALAQTFSKDPSTQVGAVLVDPVDYTQLTEGYNGMPRGMDETPAERHQRPLKYAYYEHAERNSIYNIVRTQLKGSIAVTTQLPSISCVRALLSVGVSQVVLPDVPSQSQEEALALTLLEEASVIVYKESQLSSARSQEERLPKIADMVTEAMAQIRSQLRHRRKLAQYLTYARQLALVSSKDSNPSATLFLSPDDYTQLARGYSGQPRGSQDDIEERYLGEKRDVWVESSVRNAIYNRARPLLKGSVAMVTATTCVECARALAAVGVKRIYYYEPTPDFKDRWKESIQGALDVLDELGVKHTEVLRPT